MPRLTWADTVPRVSAGSNGAPENSFSRSSATSSATAGTGASSRNRTRAGGSFGCVSGTSNTPLARLSRRPGETSTTPLPTDTVAVRPVIRAVRSASLDRRQPLDRAHHHVLDGDVDRQPVVRDRRPARLHRRHRHVGRDLDPLHRAADDVLHDPIAHLGRDEHRPQPLERGDRHLVAGDAEREARLAAEIETARQRDTDVVEVAAAELLGAEVALIEGDALPNRIDRAAHQHALEQQAVVFAGGSGSSTISPPPTANCQLEPDGPGAANSARSETRVAPELILNGTRSVPREMSQSSPNSAAPIGMRFSGWPRKPISPFSASTVPRTACGVPSGPRLASIAADTTMSERSPLSIMCSANRLPNGTLRA